MGLDPRHEGCLSLQIEEDCKEARKVAGISEVRRGFKHLKAAYYVRMEGPCCELGCSVVCFWEGRSVSYDLLPRQLSIFYGYQRTTAPTAWPKRNYSLYLVIRVEHFLNWNFGALLWGTSVTVAIINKNVRNVLCRVSGPFEFNIHKSSVVEVSIEKSGNTSSQGRAPRAFSAS